MATIIDTIEKDGKTVWLYDNGMERDASTGRMVRPPTAAIITTTEKANELQRRRQEIKQERIVAGAAKLLERTGEWETPTDMDVVEAIGEAVMLQALDPKGKKQIDAANFILREAGLAAQTQRANVPDAAPGVISAAPDTLLQLVDLLERQRAAAVERARAVDADAADVEP